MMIRRISTIIKIYFILPFEKWRYELKRQKYLKIVFKTIKRKNFLNTTIVLNPARCLKRVLISQLFMAKVLAINGAKVKILLDDGILKHWDTMQIDHLSSAKEITNFPHNPSRLHYKVLIPTKFPKILIQGGLFNTRLLFRRLFKTFKDENLEIVYYSDIIDRNNINIDNWRVLKKHAESSTIRFFKNSVLDLKDKNIKFYYNLSLKNAVISRNVGEYVLEKIRPNFFINPHGTYSTHGPAFEFLQENGVTCFVLIGRYIHSKDNPNIVFLSDTIIQLLSRSKFWQNYKENPVTMEMKNLVINYFESRINANTRDTKKYYIGERKRFRVDKGDKYKYHFAMFPNLLGDGNVRDRHIVFNGILDWLISTINYVQTRKDIKLYIKAHPAEIFLSKNVPSVLDLIRERLDLEKFENIELIPSETNIDTYDFLRSGIDLGLVYDGFLAMEIPYLKIPVIMCVKGGFSSVKGGNFIATSKKEYFEYLDNIDRLKEEFIDNYDFYFENIVRYLYWYLYVVPIKFPLLFKNRDYRSDLSLFIKEKSVLDEKLFEIFS